MRIFSAVILFTLFSNSLLAESYSREYTYRALQADNQASSRISAVDHTRTLLIEKINGHIEQIIKVSEDGSINSYARLNVEAVTADLAKIKILEEEWDGSSYYIKAEVDADPQQIADAIKEYKTNDSEENRQQISALKANEKALKTSREKISRLRRELEPQAGKPHDKKLAAGYISELEKLATGEMFAKGFEHYRQGEYSEAIDWYRKAADKGNIMAQTLIAISYMNGQGVERDYAMAKSWLLKSAEQGDAIAQYYLGMIYLNGNGVDRSDDIAADWLHKSAEQDNALAQYHLGELYLTGKGVAQKDYMAAHWLRKAAEHRVAAAQLQLGNLYNQGKGVTKNIEEAGYWYSKAAEQGLAEARRMIDKTNPDK